MTTSFACLEDGQALSDEVEISDIFDVETRASVQCGDGELRWRSHALRFDHQLYVSIHPSISQTLKKKTFYTVLVVQR